ncbi:unnamed protein product [Urochloa humidicola]
MEADTTFYVGHRSNSSARQGDSDNKKPHNKKRGKGGSNTNNNADTGGSSGSSGSRGTGTQPGVGLPWAAGYNQWTGLVQAWPMAFRALGTVVLGPRPPATT